MIKSGGRGRSLKEQWLALYRYAHIARYQAYASLRSEVEKTCLGMVWLMVQPMATALVFFAIFSFLLPNRGVNYFSIVLVGTYIWEWLATSLSAASLSIVNKTGLMQQVYIPKIIFPLVSVINACWKFFPACLVMLMGLALLGHQPDWPYLALPLVLLIQALFTLGLAFIFSAATAWVADSRGVIEAGLRLWMYLSGVFFSTALVPEHLQFYFFLNPMAILLESYRAILLHGTWPGAGRLLYVGVVTVVLNGWGLWLLHRLDLHLPKRGGNA